mgnify:FL=1
MNSFRIGHLLQFMAGWHPPRNEFQLNRSRWRTWAEYIGEWIEIREECLATEEFQRGGPNFAEQVYKTYGAKGPPMNATYDEIEAAIAENEDATVAVMLADVKVS